MHSSHARIMVVAVLVSLCGCMAAPPGGADAADVVVAPPPPDQALVVVFRNHADPRKLAARILVDGAEVMRLPEESFGVVLVTPGAHKPLALAWPPISGTPGWGGTGDWAAGSTYYYELTGTAGHGFYFRSQLIPTDARLAELKMRACCWLITEQKDSDLVRAGKPPPAPARTAAVSFGAVKAGMLQKEVIDLIGLPDEVSSDYTGKGRNPFSFSSDTFREYWIYSGSGYVAFSLNEYSNTSRVVQAVPDDTAKAKAKARP